VLSSYLSISWTDTEQGLRVQEHLRSLLLCCSMTQSNPNAQSRRNSRARSNGVLPKFDAQFETQKRTFHAIARMHGGMSLDAACREEGTTPATVKKYVPRAIRRSKKGKWVLRKNDPYLRALRLPGLHGPVTVLARGYSEAKLGSTYLAAVDRWTDSEGAYELAPFEGKSIGGHELLTSDRALRALRDAGLLQLDSLYASLKETL
jgi:hypothetical protein